MIARPELQISGRSTKSAQTSEPTVSFSGDIGGARIDGVDALICFSHLRWDFVFQRPQHLMLRFGRLLPIYYFEEPIPAADDAKPSLQRRKCATTGVQVIQPMLPLSLGAAERDALLRELLDEMLVSDHIVAPLLWYYTPMMRAFSDHVSAGAVVYDCMDELANFKFAPPELKAREQELLGAADLVFTGGSSIYDAKRGAHDSVHLFPSSVDTDHFGQARTFADDEPLDQQAIPHPRFGFHGVIDERIDLELLAAIADARPDWSFVMLGPVVKIDPATLPQRPNIHFLGSKNYSELPAYLAGWDVAIMPFAMNDATKFISPTKTPEYFAGGKTVVSTPIRDVVRRYGQLSALRVGATPEEFLVGCHQALLLQAKPKEWLPDVDRAIAADSWDSTFRSMRSAIQGAVSSKMPSLTSSRSSVRGRSTPPYDDLIVGAGFAGSVLAERLARISGRKVLLVDRRPHIGGNAYDELDAHGIMIHKYGPHIFHTNSERIVRYLSQFTGWRQYEHRVLASVGDKLVPMPINRTTLNVLYDLNLTTDEEAAEFLRSRGEALPEIRSAEDQVISQVGRHLYETFFKGYTKKQWGIEPSALDKAVTARVPARSNTDDRYFTDTFQCMPKYGYTKMFENMLDHDRIKLALGVDFADIRDQGLASRIIYSGPVDEYFGYRFGKLPYRSLKFEHVTLDTQQFQSVATVNFPSADIPYTRITEYKHLTGQQHAQTSLTYEYPCSEGDPYYPVPNAENQRLYLQYQALAERTPGVTFVGRLGTYKYYNMDQVVGQALSTFNRLANEAPRMPALISADASSLERVSA